MNRILNQILCVLLGACHELFCIFGDFDVSGMQHAEMSKSLQAFFLTWPMLPGYLNLYKLIDSIISFVASIQQQADPQNSIHDSNKSSFETHESTFKRLSAWEPIRQILVYHGLPWFFQWKITILSHEEISHLFGPTQFFLYFTERFSRSPKTSQFAVGSGAILVKL